MKPDVGLVDHLGPADGEHAPAGAVGQLVVVDLERDDGPLMAADIFVPGAVRNTIAPSTTRS